MVQSYQAGDLREQLQLLLYLWFSLLRKKDGPMLLLYDLLEAHHLNMAHLLEKVTLDDGRKLSFHGAVQVPLQFSPVDKACDTLCVYVYASWQNSGCGDADYNTVRDQILIPVARQFNPDIIMISARFDAAMGDPLGGCHVTANGYTVMLQKVISFSLQAPRAICIRSANGVIFNVTLRQPDSSGCTSTYEVNVTPFI